MICSPNRSVQELKTIDCAMSTTAQILFYRITGPMPKAISGLSLFSQTLSLSIKTHDICSFRISVGELLDNRYKSYAFTGKGVFSNVIRCKDKHEKDKDVAIKIIRKNDLMLKAGKSCVDHHLFVNIFLTYYDINQYDI